MYLTDSINYLLIKYFKLPLHILNTILMTLKYAIIKKIIISKHKIPKVFYVKWDKQEVIIISSCSYIAELISSRMTFSELIGFFLYSI